MIIYKISLQIFFIIDPKITITGYNSLIEINKY